MSRPRSTGARQWLFAAIPLLCVAALGIGAIASAQPSQTPTPPLRWAMASSSLRNISSVDAGQAARSLDRPETIVQNASPLSANPVPAGWASTGTALWRSYAQFAADVAAGAVPSYIKVAHYDNEAWPQTPEAEQRRPAYYERRFCALAHHEGLLCYLGPAKDLCNVLPQPQGDDNAQCYIDLNLAGKAARYADMIDIQAQTLEPSGARAYASFLRRTAAQARAANPDVVVLGNLSPSPGGAQLSAGRLYACADAALRYVSGFYATVNAGDGEAMVSLLRHLGG
ncbi:MAG TPA: hypothetical protein VGN84_01995 [Solirubrobacterales bacterium]|jgi:hypothetical protein|nr:hypothetical protein [Solirubrobacterales bacterium]